MISIILDADPEAIERAKAAGFTEKTVLVREEPHDGELTKLEDAVRCLDPQRFIVGDPWGVRIL